MATILFIDDDIATLQLMEKAAAVLGHSTVTSSSAEDALELARSHQPTVILVDRRLHSMNGCSLIKLIHQVPALNRIPLYLISAYLSDEDVACARQAGATGCLEKPLSLANLSQILAQAGAQVSEK